MSELSPLSPHALADRILAGENDAADLPTLTRLFAGEVDTWELMAAADRIRRSHFADEVHLCSIVNAKQGGCPEDCGFCSQSKHFSTHVSAERFLAPEEVVEASAKAQAQHASALGLVTATRGLEDDSVALRQAARDARPAAAEALAAWPEDARLLLGDVATVVALLLLGDMPIAGEATGSAAVHARDAGHTITPRRSASARVGSHPWYSPMATIASSTSRSRWSASAS